MTKFQTFETTASHRGPPFDDRTSRLRTGPTESVDRGTVRLDEPIGMIHASMEFIFDPGPSSSAEVTE